jgi:glycosyltransferase involved in cell wall biosynthesis
VLSSTYPSRTNPTLGVFVHERVRHVAQHVETVVVAPVPWFPANALVRGRAVADTPTAEVRDGLSVYHPRFLCPPLVGKTLDAALYVLSVGPFLQWLRRRFPFDVLDAHFTFPDGVAAVWLGRLFRCPVLITVRGPHDVHHASFALRRRQIRSALQRCRSIIAVSESLKGFVGSLGLEPDRVRVVPNGVDTKRFFRSDRNEARRRLGLALDRTVLLAVGTLSERKGHHRIIEILPDLVAARPNVIYVAIGAETHPPGYRDQLETLADRLGVRDHVLVLGPRAPEAIQVWMAAADVFCLATRNEGWCNAITEALVCGLPVVTTDVGGNREIVQHGHDGLLVPFWDRARFRDAVLAALDAPWDRAAISARAARRGWDQVAQEVLEALCHSLVHARRGARVVDK